MNLRDELRHTLIEYDRKESRKQGYNVYALALYMEALQSAMEYIEQGKDVRKVLTGHFTGRLCNGPAQNCRMPQVHRGRCLWISRTPNVLLTHIYEKGSKSNGIPK